MKNVRKHFLLIIVSLFSAVSLIAQEQPPAPGVPRSVAIPDAKEKQLRNGLIVSSIRKNGFTYRYDPTCRQAWSLNRA